RFDEADESGGGLENPMPLGPLQPVCSQRLDDSEGVLREHGLGRLDVPRLVRKLRSVDAAIRAGTLEQVQQATGCGIAKLRMPQQLNRRLASIVEKKTEAVVARQKSVSPARLDAVGAST